MTRPNTESQLEGPAYRITTPRLAIRCWNPSDAELLSEAIGANMDRSMKDVEIQAFDAAGRRLL